LGAPLTQAFIIKGLAGKSVYNQIVQFFSRREVKKRAKDPKNPWTWVVLVLILLAGIIRLIMEIIKFLIDK
jgi:hypothetical protein